MRRRDAIAAAVSVVLLGAVPITGAGAGTPRLERGLRYESAAGDEQRVGFWVVDLEDRKATLALHVRVRCDDLHAAGSFAATVAADGSIEGRGSASSSEPEDGPATSGVVRVDGRVTDDGRASGTLRFELVQTDDEGNTEYARCDRDDAGWEVEAGVPDASIALVRDRIQVPRSLRDLVDHDAFAATDDAAYVLTGSRDETTLRRVSTSSGDEEWSTEIPVGGFPDVVVGSEAVFVTGDDDRSRPTVVMVAARDGDVVTRLRGSAVAVGPDGTWVVTEDDDEVRRIDPATGDVVATVQVAGELGDQLAVGSGGLYAEVTPEAPIGTRPDPAIVRLDPSSGAVLAQYAAGGIPDLLADATAVWLQEPEGVTRLAPQTLAEVAVSEEYALSVATAPPGLWLDGFDAITALDPTASVAVRIPWLFGAIASSERSVWLLDRDLGLLRIDPRPA